MEATRGQDLRWGAPAPALSSFSAWKLPTPGQLGMSVRFHRGGDARPPSLEAGHGAESPRPAFRPRSFWCPQPHPAAGGGGRPRVISLAHGRPFAPPEGQWL